MSDFTIQLRFTKLNPYFEDITVLSAPVSTALFTLQLIIEIYSQVAYMLKICPVVSNITITDAGYACTEEIFSSSQKLFQLLYMPEFAFDFLLHFFEKSLTISKVLLLALNRVYQNVAFLHI